MCDQFSQKKPAPGDLLRHQSVREMITILDREREWTEHYLWYLENVLADPSKTLSSEENERRRMIEKLVPPARLAQWSEISESPQEIENLFAWMQGRLDLAEHLHEQFAELIDPANQS